MNYSEWGEVEMVDESFLQSHQPDTTAIFVDSSVLLDYTLDRAKDSSKLLLDSKTRFVTSETVRREVSNLVTRRESVYRDILEFAATGRLSEYSIPQGRLSRNDRQKLTSLIEELIGMDDDAVILKRIKERVRRVSRAEELLFESSDSIIDNVVPSELPPQIKGYLRNIIYNDSDVRVLANAAVWSENGGTGTVATTDHNDMISKRESILEVTNKNREVGTVFVFTPKEITSQRVG
ncbi:hypothetical protein [Halopiger thermotolerans]